MEGGRDPVAAADGERRCANCGDAMAADRSVCPSCGHLAAAIRRAPPVDDAPAATVPVTELRADEARSWRPPGVPVPPNVVGPAMAAPPSPPARSRGAIVLVVLVVAAVVGAAVVGVVGSRDDRSSEGERLAGSASTTTAAPVPVLRHLDPFELDRYCDGAGAAWSETPAFAAGEPARLQVEIVSAGPRGNGSDPGVVPRVLAGGSTTISPQADGAFDTEASFETTRAVACVRYLGRDATGRTCAYTATFTGNGEADRTLELAKDRYEIVVYELHSGGVLHRGEVWSGVDGCPADVADRGTGEVVRQVSDTELLAWITAHFVDGQPS